MNLEQYLNDRGSVDCEVRKKVSLDYYPQLQILLYDMYGECLISFKQITGDVKVVRVLRDDGGWSAYTDRFHWLCKNLHDINVVMAKIDEFLENNLE